ncbi:MULTISPECIES: hypothetical protein [Microbacterium]|jgi:hypothetical protein|uniref:hypothetical protein n=1 Tax=Microbacterium TaxID=33882 RepID=UPI001D1748B1|nr:hypothetical protein [Microbacterium testaceum]MCC4249696.1 hypothetical protein [Microbacterium testaceum]
MRPREYDAPLEMSTPERIGLAGSFTCRTSQIPNVIPETVPALARVMVAVAQRRYSLTVV